MKTLITFLIISLSLILVSCNSNTPIIDGPNPFIVHKISVIYDGALCKYTGSYNSTYNNRVTSTKSLLVTTCGLYSIGDTISFK